MRYLPVVISVAICLAVGFSAAEIQAESLQTWYPTLKKSPLNPPNWAFPVAWTILYVMMGISVGLIWRDKRPGFVTAVVLFAMQLGVNFAWSVAFFYCKSPVAGLATIFVLLLLLLAYMCRALFLNMMSFVLFLPYIAWVAFATYLNAYIFIHN